jgi:hypothetical protein
MRKSGSLTRSQFLQLLAGCTGLAVGANGAMLFEWLKWPPLNASIKRPQKLGTTFSQLQCGYLGVNYQEAFEHICALGFNTIRLCSYWSEIERAPNTFDFSVLDWLLSTAEKHSVDVVLTVGMKAPRWPEFHFPDWVKNRYDTADTGQPLDASAPLADLTLNFVRAVMEHTKDAPSIKYWQIENEAFNRPDVAAGRFLSYQFVEREVALARALANAGQRIVLTNGINLSPFDFSHDDEQAFKQSFSLADAVGINVYSKVGTLLPGLYETPFPVFWRKLANWRSSLERAGKEAWITEAQAEPWEHNSLVAIGRTGYPSSSPQSATDLAVTLGQLEYSPVFLWGCEYWYWQKVNGRDNWWAGLEQFIQPR